MSEEDRTVQGDSEATQPEKAVSQDSEEAAGSGATGAMEVIETTDSGPISDTEKGTKPEGGSDATSETETKPETEPETEPEPKPAPAKRPRPGILCTALHGKMSGIEYFIAPSTKGFPHGSKVILRTERGTEMGTIIASPREVDLNSIRKKPRAVIRRATVDDMNRQQSIEEDIEPTELRECQAEIDKQKLPMDLIAVEHIFGDEKICYFFMSDGRVDFRKLVRDMSERYRTRIEFRQVGVRDEARMLAEYEHCGQPLCCRQFLRGLEPVTMRMAKLQKATLDPSKISGRCGRLMCCLRYEQDVYSYLRNKLPKRGVYVLTEEVAGQVLSGDIISQKVMIHTGQKRLTINVDDIKETSREPLAQPESKMKYEMPQRQRSSSTPRVEGGVGRGDRSGQSRSSGSVSGSRTRSRAAGSSSASGGAPGRKRRKPPTEAATGNHGQKSGDSATGQAGSTPGGNTEGDTGQKKPARRSRGRRSRGRRGRGGGKASGGNSGGSSSTGASSSGSNTAGS